MKKLFAVVLIFMFVLCGCGKQAQDDISSVFTSSLPQSTDNETTLTRLPAENELSKWNTQNATNVMQGCSFLYDDASQTMYYRATTFTGKKYEYSLVAENGNNKRIITEEDIDSLYLCDNTLYYSLDNKICRVNTDGTNKKVISKHGGKNVVAVWDGVLYINYDDWKIHKISADGTDSVLDTKYQVGQFMVYNGKIFYGGFLGYMSDILELRCFDPETKTDIQVVDAVLSFCLSNDKLYFINPDKILQIYDSDLKFWDIGYDIYGDVFYPCEDGVYYYGGDASEIILRKYDYNSSNHKVITTMQEIEYMCGPYLCSNNYEGGESIRRWDNEQDPKATKYIGKEKYTDVSLGYSSFAQSDDSYYYIDFVNFVQVDKKSGEKKRLYDSVAGHFMFSKDNTIYLFRSDDAILTYDLNTKDIGKITYKGCFADSLHRSNLFPLKNGFVVSDEDTNTYFVDGQLKKKKLLNLSKCYYVVFVLDRDIFYIGEDSNIYSYNIDTEKCTYVTDYKATLRDYENLDKHLSSEILYYLGKGKILIYGDEKLQILNLSDGSSFRPYTEKQEKSMEEISAIYDDDAIYFMIWESAIEYRVDALSYETLTPKTIYRGIQTEKEEDWWHEVKLVSCDKEYLYFEDLYSLGKENYFRIKKDGSGREILFYYYPLDTNETD